MGSKQQYCLRWNNHQTNILSVFDQLLQTESFVDVTLACDGLSLKAHKVVLSACSPYFQRLLLDNPCQHPIVILNHVNYTDLRSLVDFMYKGEVNVQHDQLQELLKTAELLKIKGLSEVAPTPTPAADSAATVTSCSVSERPYVQTTVQPAGSDSGVVRSSTEAGMQSPVVKRKRGRARKLDETLASVGTDVDEVRLAINIGHSDEEEDMMVECQVSSMSVDETPPVTGEVPPLANTIGLVLPKVEADSESELSVPRIHEGFNTDNEDANNSNLESPSYLGIASFSPSSSHSLTSIMLPSISPSISQPGSDTPVDDCGGHNRASLHKLGKFGVSVTTVPSTRSVTSGGNCHSQARSQRSTDCCGVKFTTNVEAPRQTALETQQPWPRQELETTLEPSVVMGGSRVDRIPSDTSSYAGTDPWPHSRGSSDGERRDLTMATNWTESDLHGALEAVRSGRLSVTRAALTFGIPNTTLWQRSRRDSLDAATPSTSATRSTQATWSEGSLTQALDAVRGGRMSVNRASATFGIPGTTLWSRARRHGIETSRRGGGVGGGGGGWEQQEERDETMWHALQAVKHGAVSVTQASIRFNVPYTTLWKQWKKWEITGSLALAPPPSVTAAELAATNTVTSSPQPPHHLTATSNDAHGHHTSSLHPPHGGAHSLAPHQQQHQHQHHHHSHHHQHHQSQPHPGHSDAHPGQSRSHPDGVSDSLPPMNT